jgi:hypothetical protein
MNGKEGMTNLMKGNPICPYIKNIPGFF